MKRNDSKHPRSLVYIYMHACMKRFLSDGRSDSQILLSFFAFCRWKGSGKKGKGKKERKEMEIKSVYVVMFLPDWIGLDWDWHRVGRGVGSGVAWRRMER